MSLGGRNMRMRTFAGAGLVILFAVVPGAARAMPPSGSPHSHTRPGQAAMHPAPTHADALTGVSCPRVGHCVAVGSYVVGTATKTLAESLNGTIWRVRSTPNPVGATIARLGALACTRTSACMAVGFSGTNFNFLRP